MLRLDCCRDWCRGGVAEGTVLRGCHGGLGGTVAETRGWYLHGSVSSGCRHSSDRSVRQYDGHPITAPPASVTPAAVHPITVVLQYGGTVVVDPEWTTVTTVVE